MRLGPVGKSNKGIWTVLVLAIGAMAVFGAEDAWTKVGKLKSGTELRIFKKGSKVPVLAKMDEATDERLVVVVKNEQTAIPKEDIDQIDYRPPQTGSRVNKETRTTTDDHYSGKSYDRPGPNTSTSSTVSIGSKPDFETIYRRTSASMHK